ncbi:uncharacterized protein [Montipora capricornis]|uniref:uncharacterized protein n=1 Tax=Montipora capricornis TaxID=246305 RepID=UPI0035F17BE7
MERDIIPGRFREKNMWYMSPNTQYFSTQFGNDIQENCQIPTEILVARHLAWIGDKIEERRILFTQGNAGNVPLYLGRHLAATGDILEGKYNSFSRRKDTFLRLMWREFFRQEDRGLVLAGALLQVCYLGVQRLSLFQHFSHPCRPDLLFYRRRGSISSPPPYGRTLGTKFFLSRLTIYGILRRQYPLSQRQKEQTKLNENGTTFSESIEIDEEQKVEIFRVPAHNDVPAADFYNDFKMANSQRGSLPTSTKPNLLKPTGPAHRPYLTKEMLAFCGTLPIYKADVSPMNTANRGEEIIWSERRRDTRQTEPLTVYNNFTACEPNKLLDKVAACMKEDWNLNCRLEPGNCYYYVSCRMRKPGKDVWLCERTHLTFPSPVCCELICPPPSSTPPTPAS